MTHSAQILRTKLEVETEFGAFLGDTRIRLLEAIAIHGSISQAAKKVPLSYKAAWDAIDNMNNLAEQPLVLRSAGGRQGGGTQLTAYGTKVVALYRALEAEYQAALDRLTASLHQESDNDFQQFRQLLRRMSMKSSARNQFAGEIVGLMGRNGIGKSTMARTLCGLLEPVSGKICRNGRPANARERLRSSFLVMQDVNYQLFSDSVREEVLLGAAHPERCDAVLQALGLDGLADRHPMSLSGGQKQRVVVAAAMLSDKPLILLDEPTSGLDLGSMQQVGQLLQEWKAQGKTLLVITHDEELAANWCDRVIRWDDTEGV